jgi:hypothetical protein
MCTIWYWFNTWQTGKSAIHGRDSTFMALTPRIFVRGL